MPLSAPNAVTAPRARRVTGLAGVVLVSLLAFACSVWAYPKPATVPYRWELSFDPGPLRLYVDAIDGRAYWYFTYTVTNGTGEDQIWAPALVLFTDVGEILQAGRGVTARVEESIRDLLGNALLETQNEVIGDLLQGKEHARDGLAVWPADRVDVNEIAMFVSGLSGETARIRNPVTQEELILRKTLQRDYLIPGEASALGSNPIGLVSQRWILR